MARVFRWTTPKSRPLWVAAIALSLLTCTPRALTPPAPPGSGAPPGAGVIDATPPPPERGGEDERVVGNVRVRSFSEAKRALGQIYARHRVDLYCGCTFELVGRGLRVDHASCGYVAVREGVRAGRIEWEHVVPASAFGRTFPEWTSGDERCVDSKGKPYKGRPCASRSPEFARMEGDLHNLFPVVGEVNALRSDLPIGLLDPPDRAPPKKKPATAVFRFGACESVIDRGVFLPRPQVRGDVARAALYMNRAYPARVALDEPRRALFARWSTEDPPDAWERERNRLITERQGNANPFIEKIEPPGASLDDAGDEP